MKRKVMGENEGRVGGSVMQYKIKGHEVGTRVTFSMAVTIEWWVTMR